MANEKLSAPLSQLQVRKERIDAVLERIGQFPGVGSETIIDRNLKGLSGPEFLDRLVQLFETDGLLDQIKNKLETKTRSGLISVADRLHKESLLVQKAGENLERIKELVAVGRLPERYIKDAEREYQAAQGVMTVSRQHISIEPQTIEPQKQIESSDLLSINFEEKTVTVGGRTVDFKDDELRLLDFGRSRPDEWRETLDFVEGITGVRDTSKRPRLYQALNELRRKLGTDTNAPRFESSGMGPKGGKYRFLMPELGEAPKEEPSAQQEPEVKEKETKIEGFYPTINPEEMWIQLEDRKLDVTEQQMELLEYLYESAGIVSPTRTISKDLYGNDDHKNLIKARNGVTQLRQKMGQDGQKYILTVTGEHSGFMFAPPSPNAVLEEAEPEVVTAVESEQPVETQETISEEVISDDTTQTEETLLEAEMPARVVEAAVVEIEETEPEDNLITVSEGYHLARYISTTDSQTLEDLGIRLHPDDKDSVRSIVDNLSQKAQGTQDELDRGKLKQKLNAFIEDISIFDKYDDENLQLILVHFAQIREDQVDEIVNSI